MANDVHTIIIRDETKGKSTNNVTQSQVSSDGTIVSKKIKKPSIHKGRPRTKGSIEYNRFQRPINAIGNKLTGGLWERTNRFGRASYGLMVGGNLVGYGIIMKFAFDMFYKEMSSYFTDVETKNQNDLVKIKVGEKDIGIANRNPARINFITGRVHYNNNR